jgi:hypothetical protein
MADDEVADLAFALPGAGQAQQPGRHQHGAEALVDPRPADGLDHPGLVFQRDEQVPLAVGGRWRMVTMPAWRTSRPGGQARRASAVSRRRRCSCGRSSCSGWRRRVRPVLW